MTVKQTVEITNKLGMHARPAMKLFELMQGFDAEVLLRNDEGTEAEANSVIALLMLDSAKGRQIEVEATGPQEEEALAAVIALFNAGFRRRLRSLPFRRVALRLPALHKFVALHKPFSSQLTHLAHNPRLTASHVP